MRANEKLQSQRTRTLRRSMSVALLGAGAAFFAGRDAHAQSSATQKPMPNVLLLVDTSGSMERMADSSLPSANVGVTSGGLPNACSPGVESNPNRWGQLLQALTGSMQPYYSCAAVNRSSGGAGAAFRNEYKIGGVSPYDTDYVLPYHRPLTGTAGNNTTCAIGPNKLPGGSTGTSGVGPGSLGYGTSAGQGGDVRDFPDDALQTAKYSHMLTQYGANSALSSPLGTNSCTFDQSLDGQLDAARDYVRFALMTFDNDENASIGVNGGTWPPQGGVQTGSGAPFLGLWSYRRDPSNPSYALGTLTPGGAEGLPQLCAPPQQPFEVGARHWGAPPWEGRMVPFPAEDASMLEIQKVNERIQNVLLATRPYGATPIDGMMDDARDYLWYNSTGPKIDPYIASANCRDQYIVLLTDGAPNLDLRPTCTGPGGNCPFPSTASQTAAALYADTSRRVTTFVIGFSVNGSSTTGGDGFPAPYNTSPNNNCKAWYAGVGGTPTAMASACTTTPPAAGTTAEACCALNRIAYEGSGGASAPSSNPAVGPFFAESQADIVLAFGKILAAITKVVATRTTPAYTPAVYNASGFGTGATTAQFLGSFIPNAQKPWSGEILRERSTCNASAVPEAVTPSIAQGDSMAVNLATQSAANRLFVTAVPDKYTGTVSVGSPATNQFVDAARTVRPFHTTAADGIPSYSATESAARDWNLKGTTDMQLALQIDKSTCKRGRAATTSGTGSLPIPALDLDSGEACTRVVMGFTTGHVGSISETGTVPGGSSATYDFNLRCQTGGSPSAGRCSLTNAACDVADPSACSTIGGQVCVPTCSPLGAVFRANPVVNGPPDALIRDTGYRSFQAYRSKRKPTLFAATTDGILHAFKAVETAQNAHHELWSFIPPAVLPRLASNYPSGNQVLLDGSPVVRDVVWERAPADLETGAGLSPGSKWHTSLVAGLGAGGGGYYSVNVTDSDCGNFANPTITGECATTSGSTGYQAPAKGNLDEAGAADYASGAAKRGPHFMWQLTDIPKDNANDPAKVTRRSRDGQEMVALFGSTTGTPAITTLQIKTSNGDRQVGVAILPGGIDGPPVAGATCDRVATAAQMAHDLSKPPRTAVRRWAQDCTGPYSAVPGRGVTIVRLDNGQIIRHFGQQRDIPQKIYNAGVVTDSPFDSPMVGTPVVYPQTTGAVGQKIFIGDADGTVWRLDVSNSDPTKWSAVLFADLFSGRTAAESQPIQVSPIISLDANGALVLNVGTGDQESIIYKAGEVNFITSILETRPTSAGTPARAQVQWVETLTNGERVTGPMTVFDRTLYLATFAPRVPTSGQCDNAGVARLWGLNYREKEASGTGGMPMWCNTVNSAGVCTSTGYTKNQDVTGANAGYVIPGVTIRATQACSKIEDIGDGTGTGFSTLTPSEFQLTYGVGKARSPSSGFPPAATLTSSRRPLPRVATTVNAWALVVD